MKKTYSFIILLLILTSCERKIEIPEKSKIVLKYVVFDENISRKVKACSDDNPKTFDKMNSWDCSFKLEENIFDIEKKITLNEEGHMMKLELLPAEKYVDYNKYAIEKDTIDYMKISGNDITIKLLIENRKIVDYPDTLEIIKVYPKEKLILVESKKKNGKRNIYQYK